MEETVRDLHAPKEHADQLRHTPKLAIIGANEFQNPLILAAKARGIETHVFAWEAGDVGEKTADFFHPISITEIDAIAAACREIGVDGVASIGSDLANITVAGVAAALGLTANSVECVDKSTNKELMRRAFEEHGDPSPKSVPVTADTDLSALDLAYPVIVKPADRSGSRGITKLESPAGLAEAVDRALGESFAKEALVEEFACGDEYSVEYISWEGEHRFLSVTEKFTTGAPMFIEQGHLEPARISAEREAAIRAVVEHALDSLGVRFGASHSEVKVDADGTVKIIEIGSRMGGDCIGSHLVPLSCGYDFVGAVIDVALGVEPPRPAEGPCRAAAVRFVFSDGDEQALAALQAALPESVEFVSPIEHDGHAIVDSGSRYGFFIFSGDNLSDVEPYLPAIGGAC
ncbi:ATP-grasp domain-containing protein [Eggerthellaceae bacterium 24-137]